MYRNGYALLLSGATTSVLGMVYWMLAARYYSADVLGFNSGLLSAMLLLAGAGQLSLNGALVRFIPIAGGVTRRLVTLSYAVSVVASIVISIVFYLGVGYWSPALRILLDRPMLGGAFIVATTIWSIFALQDSVLTGLRQTIWIPVENTIFAVFKIVLLIVFARLFPQYGIFASWIIPVAFALIPVNFVIFRRFIPSYDKTATRGAEPQLRKQIIKFISGNYPGTLFLLASTTLLPLIVIQQAGATANAHFYLPWMIMGALQLVSINMTTSFTVEAMTDRSQVGLYCYRVLVHVLRMLVPLVAVVVITAPYVLTMFGAEYAAEGSTLLRLLALSTIPNSVVLTYLSLARVNNRVGTVLIIQGSLCIIGLGLSYILISRFYINGVGFAWIISQGLVALAIVISQLRPALALVRRRRATA
jgi:O-antigen/teichoic acid export membrane protein